MSGKASGRRAQQVRRAHRSTGSTGPADLSAVLQQQVLDEAALRFTALEIAKGMGSLILSDLLDLSDEQRTLAQRATVLYCDLWLEHHGIDPHEGMPKSTVHATHGHPLRKGGQG